MFGVGTFAENGGHFVIVISRKAGESVILTTKYPYPIHTLIGGVVITWPLMSLVRVP